MKFSLIKLDSVNSTNTYLKKIADQGAVDGTVVVAERQTGGKGRWQRYWFSPKGSLYCSILLRSVSEGDAVALQFISAISIVQVLHRHYPQVLFGLKWPNDVMTNGKKIGGILIEKTPHYAVVGIGINIMVKHFPEELQNKATSLYLLSKKKVGAESFLEEILQKFDETCVFYKKEGFFSIIRLYKQHWIQKDKLIEILVNDNRIRGFARDIDANGYLLLETEDGNMINIQQGETEFVTEYKRQ